MESEELTYDEDFKSPIEFIVVKDKLILMTIEAKRQDWDRGRAQLLMQLYNRYLQNIKNSAPINHVLYGNMAMRNS